MGRRDIEIAQSATLRPITEIAAGLDLAPDDLELYGRHMAKVTYPALQRLRDRPLGRLVLVTAISPTPAGEGKTTTVVGLGQALSRLGKRAAICLREPSLGPSFGIKGGAAGGGYSQVLPMEDINLHFTGDIHAVGAAANLIAAAVYNHIHHGNELAIDTNRVTWRRAIDISDRELRQVVAGLGTTNGVVHETGFDITVASEVMAILCLAEDLADLKVRLARAVVGFRRDWTPVTVGQLGLTGAAAALLKHALKPNLVQTIEGTPAFVHGGPFANIAHGTNTVIATRTALALSDVVVTEAGFGSDLGAEKFLHIVGHESGLRPDVLVLVTTIRALKYHGGVARARLDDDDVPAMRRGLANLVRHQQNLARFGIPYVVALNVFDEDGAEEIEALIAAEDGLRGQCLIGQPDPECHCPSRMIPVRAWAEGGAGALELAQAVLDRLDRCRPAFQPVYTPEDPLTVKIEKLAREVYGAAGVAFDSDALRTLKRFEKSGFGGLPVCMAKTQDSFSDRPELLGAPEGYELRVTGAALRAGAGFVVVYCGDILTMPGLPARPAAMEIDIDDEGKISGLF